MNKDHIPFNALIVGPTGCGKTQFIIEQLLGPFRYQFDYIVLLCPTYVRNKTWDGIGIKDEDFYVDILDPNNLSSHLKFWHGTFLKEDNTQVLLILDDIACGDDVKKRTSELIKLAFSGRRDNVSVWLLSQQLTSVSKPYRENIGSLVVFYTPSKADLETILSDYGGEITKEELKLYMRQLKKHQHSKMIFSLRYPYSVSLLKYIMDIEEILREEIPQQLGEDDRKEQLNILVSSGRAKEMIGKNLTHEDVKKLSEEDVKKFSKRYEAALAAKTTDAVADSAIKLATKLLGFALPIDDIEALQKDLQNDYVINNELKIKAGWLSLKCGSLMAVASAGLHIAQHINLEELTMSWKDFKKSRLPALQEPDKELDPITLDLSQVPVPGTIIEIPGS